MRKLAFAALLLTFMSCAPRFTVYIRENDRINTNGIIILSIKGQPDGRREVTYVLSKYMGRAQKSMYKRRQRKIKEEVDKLSR